MRTALGFAVGMAMALVAPGALAQDNPPAGGTAGGTVGGTADAQVTPPAPPKVVAPAPAAAPAKAEDDGVTDHEKVIGRFAVGYMGMTNIPLGAGDALNVSKTSVPAPIIGVRYWMNNKVGLDLGVGLALASSSLEVETNNQKTTTDGPGIFGGAVHGGVPIALNTGKHYTFQIVPEANIGFASRTDKFQGTNPPPDLKHTGFRLDVGARAGAEIHFGFIGVPELALQATVGLYISRQVWHNSQDQGNPIPATPQSSSIGETALTTTVESSPWALFTNNISALYYF